jgi:hypothetical protein
VGKAEADIAKLTSDVQQQQVLATQDMQKVAALFYK